MAILELKDVRKGYGEGEARTQVLGGIDLRVEEGEFVAILGFSGSGKTTLISAIAGLIEPDTGEILFKGAPVRGPGPERGVVFQSYSLMPWLSVEGNVALAVDAVFAGESKARRRERVKKYIGMVEADHRNVFVDAFAPLCPAFTAEYGVDGQRDVAGDGQPRHQRVALEDDAAVRPRSSHRLALEQHGASVGRHQPRDRRDQRRLAGTGEADDGDELALLDRQVDVSEDLRPLAAFAVGFAHAGKF